VYNSNISKLTVANGDVECENFIDLERDCFLL